MIDFFVKQWDKNKNILREYFENNKMQSYDTYEELVKLVLKLVINKNVDDEDDETINIDKLIEIDYGEYQGSLIYVFPTDTYQPEVSEIFYTTVEYGSCSVCDTLASIIGYNDEKKPNKHQVDMLMKLSLNLVQNTHRFKDWYE